jgi:hypothetical protein
MGLRGSRGHSECCATISRSIRRNRCCPRTTPHSPMLTPRQKRLFVCLLAGAISLTAASNTRAGDVAYDLPCDACPRLDSGLNSQFYKPGCFRLRGFKGGCLKGSCLCKFFDAMTNRFQRLLLCKCGCGSFGRCGLGKLCDDGCDAAMMDELMMPAPIRHDRRPMYSPQPLPADTAPVPSAQIVRPATPEPEWRTIQPLPQDQPVGRENAGFVNERRPLAPTRIPIPEPQLSPPTEVDAAESQRGSLFDALSDPFRDDQSRKRTYQSVRPSSYHELGLRPVRRMPLPRPHTASSLPAKSVR